jgi:hypothetical protein
VLLGLVAIGPLVVVEDLFFAWRGLDVLGHYLDPIDVAAVVAASVAVGAGVDAAIAALRTRGPGMGRAAGGVLAVAVVAAAVLAVAITPSAPLSAGARASLGRQADLAVREKRALPVLACAIGMGGGGATCAPAPDPGGLQLFLPSLQLIGTVVDLGIPVTRAPAIRRTIRSSGSMTSPTCPRSSRRRRGFG